MSAKNWRLLLVAVPVALILLYFAVYENSLFFKHLNMEPFTTRPELVTKLVFSMALHNVMLLLLAGLLGFSMFKYYRVRQGQRLAQEEIIREIQMKEFVTSVLNSTPLAIMTADNHMKISFVNRAWESLVGYTGNEVEGKDLSELLGLLQAKMMETGTTERNPGFPVPGKQLNITGKNGQLIHVTLDTTPLMRGDTREGTIIYVMDISAEVKYDNLKQTAATILEQMLGGVIAVDASGKVTMFNRSAEQITGIEASHAIGRSLTDLFPKVAPEKLVPLQALQKGAPVGPVEEQWNFQGKNYILLTSADVLREKNGRISGAVTVFHDITQLRHQQDLDHNREKLAVVGQMAAGMAHELRNPLTSVKGFAQLLGERLADEKNKEYLNIIIREIDRTNEIIRDFLLLARPRSPRGELVDLNQLLNDLLPLIESQCLLTEVDLVRCQDPALPVIPGEPDQLKQVLLNLIHNALQAMEGREKKTLTLATHYLPDSGEIKVVVRDTGTGMSPEVLKRLGTPFFTTKDAGTGLGLTVSYRIIENHGGRVEVESHAGAGSEFRLYLPVPPSGQKH
ncbi:PAS domain S-box protein [Desulfofundulus thermobenzoicus]|uniref:histidine kinase n=1 Tax=Desulfofundulus thermobenzoicus TaxID=29376 RepID=A0A6N7ISP3_9FIRM|nr:PAS domain S-box protein [Desulfofundulus thermobenzoicus]MQL52477.1 PAS domain S-box protein [Desulfofundulus thermobenzoicus]